MRRILSLFIPLLLFVFFVALPAQAATTKDMISSKSERDKCLTVDGVDPATVPSVVLDTCRGTDNQIWIYETDANGDMIAGQWKTKMSPEGTDGTDVPRLLPEQTLLRI